MQGKTEEEIEMMKQMGFGSFDTTKVRIQRCPVLSSHKEVQCKFIAFFSWDTNVYVSHESVQCNSSSTVI